MFAGVSLRSLGWPRSLDVDVVACENMISEDPRLILPHPRAHERAFVLLPWLDVEPDATLRVGGDDVPVTELLGRLSPEERAGVIKQEGVGDGLW